MRSHHWILLFLVLMILGAGAGARFMLPGFFSIKSPAGAGGPSVSEPLQTVVCFGRVDLLGGCVLLQVAHAGRVESVLVTENQPLRAGDAILALSQEDARARVDEARAALKVALLQVGQARDGLDQHKVRLRQQGAAIRIAEQQLTGAREQLAHQEDLKTHALAGVHPVEVARAKVEELTALRVAESEKLALLHLEKPAREVEKAGVEVERCQALVHQAEQYLADCTLKAPAAGRVVRLLAVPGELAGGPTAGPAALFAPDEPYVIRAEMQQEFASLVTPGRVVRIEDRFNSHIHFRGKVTRISSWYLPPRNVIVAPEFPNTQQTLECLVTPEEGAPPLRLGQQVRVVFEAPANR
jgi:multidrug efflux pump subunit AcrA (membrane-fusion protein)